MIIRLLRGQLLLLSLFILFPSYLWAACQGASPNWTVAAPYDSNDVQECVNSASNGDTITIPVAAGSKTWSGTVVIPTSKGVTIIGETVDPSTVGCGSCRVKLTGNGMLKFSINLASYNSYFTRISGIEFSADTYQQIQILATTLWGGQTAGRYRIDHNYFNYSRGIHISSNQYGVIDNNVFHEAQSNLATGGVGYTFWLDGATGCGNSPCNQDTGYTSWQESVNWGDQYSHYIENNTITFDDNVPSACNFTDGRGGAMSTWRYNTFTNSCFLGGHDLFTSQQRGTKGVEAYGNVFRYTQELASQMNTGRGGGWLVYDNKFQFAVAPSQNPLQFTSDIVQRYLGPGQYPWYGCDGTPKYFCLKGVTPCSTPGTPGDCLLYPGDSCVEIDTSGGYPCRDQVGYSGNDMHLNPMTFWNNLQCTTGADCTANQYSPLGWPSGANPVVHWGVEAIDYDSTTNTGTCVGVVSDFCTTYWDDVNKKRKNYTPYTYPHPLRGEGGPIDTEDPVVTAFVIPATNTSLRVPITTFTATDNVGVTGYCLSETNVAATCTPWAATRQTYFDFTTQGAKTIYGFAKDAAGNYSASLNDSVTITLPDAGVEVEAENVVLVSPMVIGTDVAASGGYYIYSGTNNSGSAIFTYNNTNSGTCKLTVKVNNKYDGGENSFRVGINTEVPGTNDYYAYAVIPLQFGYFTDEVNRFGNGIEAPEFDPFTFPCPVGLITVTFYAREANTWLDTLKLELVQPYIPYGPIRIYMRGTPP